MEARRDVEQARLAAARGADDDGELVRLHLEGDAVERQHALLALAIGEGDVLDGEAALHAQAAHGQSQRRSRRKAMSEMRPRRPISMMARKIVSTWKPRMALSEMKPRPEFAATSSATTK